MSGVEGCSSPKSMRSSRSLKSGKSVRSGRSVRVVELTEDWANDSEVSQPAAVPSIQNFRSAVYIEGGGKKAALHSQRTAMVLDADLKAPALHSQRTAMIPDSCSESGGKKPLRAQRTAMIPDESDLKATGLHRQRTAMMSDIRISRTAMMSNALGASSFWSEAKEEPSDQWMVVKVASGAKAAAQGLVGRGWKTWR